jgi:hypothetical protein
MNIELFQPTKDALAGRVGLGLAPVIPRRQL